MENKKDCTGPHVGLAVMTVTLLVSMCLNLFLYSLRRKDRQNRDVDLQLYHNYFPIVRLEDEEEQNQDNPIYGNIFVDGQSGSMLKSEYEEDKQMPKKATGQDKKSHPEEISYASLDLKLLKKNKKKKRYREEQNQTHMVQTHPAPVPQMRSTSPTSSIYLNSHQVALRTEELQREREQERDRETE